MSFWPTSHWWVIRGKKSSLVYFLKVFFQLTLFLVLALSLSNHGPTVLYFQLVFLLFLHGWNDTEAMLCCLQVPWVPGLGDSRDSFIGHLGDFHATNKWYSTSSNCHILVITRPQKLEIIEISYVLWNFLCLTSR